MLRQRLPLMFIAVSALSALAAHAEDRLLLKSVNVDLPVGDRMFEGPGSDVANNNCLACHSAGMVLFQPALSQAQWHAEVEKMRTALQGADRSQGCRHNRCVSRFHQGCEIGVPVG
jgi:hypothetical protein